MYWQTSRFKIDLSRPQVMGIVNVTPDSFSDGGQFASHSAAMAHCEQLLKEGADILDIGGESTRPGAPAVSEDEEMARLLPVLRHSVRLGVPISVDTYKPAVMQAALDLGADIINDVWALRWCEVERKGSGVEVVQAHGKCGVCLMHMHRDPQTMQTQPMEGEVLPQVLDFLRVRAGLLQKQGIQKDRICLDPGIGFGKTVQQNFALLARQAELLTLGYPLLAGWSRKSSLAAVTQNSWASAGGPDTSTRMVASVAAALLAVQNGAAVVRVHDVAPTVQAFQILAATRAAVR
jgi:dihydropteroate synthase